MGINSTDHRARDLLLPICFLLSFLPGCSNVSSDAVSDLPSSEIELLGREAVASRDYEILGAVAHRCTKRTCTGIDQDHCSAELLKKATKLEADAVVVLVVTEEGRGHGGSEIFAVSCTGNAIRFLSDP